MHLSIETDIASHYLPPVEPPLTTPQGFKLAQPQWVSNMPCEQTLFDVGSDRSWKCATSGVSIIGRNERSTIVVENLLVSRCHAAILHHFSGRNYLVDLGSAHGTYLGKQRLRPLIPTMIPDAALIRFGIYGSQFVLKKHATLKIVLSEDLTTITNKESYINTMMNRTLSFPGFTCEMEIHGDYEVKTGKVGMSKYPSREDLHRTETLDCEGLMKYQTVIAQMSDRGSGAPPSLTHSSALGVFNTGVSAPSSSSCASGSVSPGAGSLSSSDSVSDSGSLSVATAGCKRQGSPSGDPTKRVRFTAPSAAAAAAAAVATHNQTFSCMELKVNVASPVDTSLQVQA